MNIPCSIDKIKFNKTSNNYVLSIKNDLNLRTFFIEINSKDAKNISLAKNNIFSERLNTYEMFINLINLLKIKIARIHIVKKNDLFSSKLYLLINDNYKILDCSIVDSLVIAYKTLTQIYVKDSLFNQLGNKYLDTNKYYLESNNPRYDKSDKLNKLSLSLEQLIKEENYESAAIIRDRISFLKKE